MYHGISLTLLLRRRSNPQPTRESAKETPVSNVMLRLYRGLFTPAFAGGAIDRLRVEHDWASAAAYTAADHRREHRAALEDGLGGCPYCA